jgi:hypothetical protein
MSDNHVDPDDHEEALMTIRNWRLIRSGSDVIRRYNLYSYIMHACHPPEEPITRQFWWSLDLINTKCRSCHEYPPDEMMGLWKMHNWEYIQNGGRT